MSNDDIVKKLQKENRILKHKLERIDRSRKLLEARWDRNSNLFLALHEEIEKTNQELEKARKAAEAANRAKSDFLANMSHELRTPLNSVIGFAEMILDEIYGEVPSEIREVVGEIQKSGEHLLGLINDVLDISKIEAGRIELKLSENAPEDPIEVTIGRTASLAKAKGLELIAEIHDELPHCNFDLHRIKQVLFNL